MARQERKHMKIWSATLKNDIQDLIFDLAEQTNI